MHVKAIKMLTFKLGAFDHKDIMGKILDRIYNSKDFSKWEGQKDDFPIKKCSPFLNRNIRTLDTRKQ